MPQIKTQNFAAVIEKQLAADPKLADRVANEEFNAYLAMEIYKAREAAGLTQTQLAKRAGTTQSVISRLEDADYGGRSITLLQRIAAALGVRFRVRFERENCNAASTIIYSDTIDVTVDDRPGVPLPGNTRTYEVTLPSGNQAARLPDDVFVGA